jgi:hypothetical protein
MNSKTIRFTMMGRDRLTPYQAWIKPSVTLWRSQKLKDSEGFDFWFICLLNTENQGRSLLSGAIIAPERLSEEHKKDVVDFYPALNSWEEVTYIDRLWAIASAFLSETLMYPGERLLIPPRSSQNSILNHISRDEDNELCPGVFIPWISIVGLDVYQLFRIFKAACKDWLVKQEPASGSMQPSPDAAVLGGSQQPKSWDAVLGGQPNR